MATRKDQHKAGTPRKPRGQQTGFAGNPDQNRAEMKKTADAVTPSTNSPSTVVKTGRKGKISHR